MYMCTYINISIILYIVPLHCIVDVDFFFKFLARLFSWCLLCKSETIECFFFKWIHFTRAM